MAESIFALPVSVEQIAAVIQQMGQAEQRHLLELVPNLRVLLSQSPNRTKQEAQERVAQLRKTVLASIKNAPLSPDEAFLGNLTLRQYHALSDKEKTALWKEWETEDIAESPEREVDIDAMPVR
jgi:hypothetical protein